MYRREQDWVDGVLLDFSMPGTSGLEIYDQLMEINDSVRVLLSSGLIEGIDLKKARGRGIRGFIRKPYSADDLSSKMKEVLG